MPDLRLGLNLGYSGAQIQLPMDMVQEADRLGFYAVWTAELYGSDSVTPLAWIGALTQAHSPGHGNHADAGPHSR